MEALMGWSFEVVDKDLVPGFPSFVGKLTPLGVVGLDQRAVYQVVGIAAPLTSARLFWRRLSPPHLYRT